MGPVGNRRQLMSAGADNPSSSADINGFEHLGYVGSR
jgi:hypothetical protein